MATWARSSDSTATCAACFAAYDAKVVLEGFGQLPVLAGSLPSAMWPALSRWIEGGAWDRDNAPGGTADLEFRDWQVIDLAGAAEHADLCEAALSYLLERMRLEIEDPSGSGAAQADRRQDGTPAGIRYGGSGERPTAPSARDLSS